MAKIIAIAAGACLATTLLAVGFAACASPWATRAFSTAFASYDVSPYLPSDLVDLAVATRDYTVEDCGRASGGTEVARERLSQLTVEAAQRASAPDSPVQNRWNAAALSVLQGNWDTPNLQAYALADVSDRYALSSDALEHPDDCYTLIGGVVPWLMGIAISAVVLLVTLVGMGRRKLAGAVLFRAPIVLAAFMAMCGIWAAVDFNWFFGVFHAVLFPQGNWTFPADSLLICMLPLNFWVSMGALWLAVTVLACIIAMLLGKRLIRCA
ncbi:MAG: DUF1461 domain-containing protein [Eggerthellaceae bacterium]|nr:DUF1461 domain-containing protein [Eggerthellaceae bacterium]